MGKFPSWLCLWGLSSVPVKQALAVGGLVSRLFMVSD